MGTFYVILYDYINTKFSHILLLCMFYCQLLDSLCITSAKSQSHFGFVLESFVSSLCLLTMLYFTHLGIIVSSYLPEFYDKLILKHLIKYE